MNAILRHVLPMLALSFGLSTAMANPPADPLRAHVPTQQERELKKQIDRLVTYPLLERKRVLDGVVTVSFVINAAGRVEVITANSDNAELRAYVLRKLERIDIGENPSGTWKTEHMRFVFRPEA